MNSRIIPATVSHKRLLPRVHEFSYNYACLLLDLDELENLDRSLRLFGVNRPRLVSLSSSDYLDPGPEPIPDKLRTFLASQAGKTGQPDDQPAASRVLMLTAGRVFGRVFNPVSFFFLFTPDNRLNACIAEVNNTFGDKHVYLLDHPESPDGFPVRYRTAKVFHVSPFFDMHGEYAFAFSDIRQELDIAITLVKDGAPVLEARLLQRAPARALTDGNILATWLRHPLAPNLTYVRILRQAASLYFGKKLAVHERPQPVSPMTIRTMPTRLSWVDRFSRRLTLWNLGKMRKGRLEIRLPDGEVRVLQGPEAGPSCAMRILDDRLFRALLQKEDVGLGDGYVQGMWTTDDLPGLMELLVMNMGAMAYKEDWGLLGRAVHRGAVLAGKMIPDNDVSGSRCNIKAHYDLSNDLFALFLDQGMTYSCAVFENLEELRAAREPVSEETLRLAQERKYRLIADAAGLGPGRQVLEIGCGWGGFAVFAAEQYGCRVDAVTISEQQHAYVHEMIRGRGLAESVTARMEDFRNLQGRYDAVVSIEMIEAVGHNYHPEYFRAVDRLLKPRGRACIQAITILDQRYETYRKTKDWISTCIFPGGLLPSLSRICDVLAKQTSLFISDIRDIGPHYGLTLATWRSRFLANRERIEALGFDAQFRRTWEYYFSICEAAFNQRHIRDLQIVLERPKYMDG
jgi:cyclopropane-fatty-acyl-phospholipid synthase